VEHSFLRNTGDDGCNLLIACPFNSDRYRMLPIYLYISFILLMYYLSFVYWFLYLFVFLFLIYYYILGLAMWAEQVVFSDTFDDTSVLIRWPM
jgi:hypothetical protein